MINLEKVSTWVCSINVVRFEQFHQNSVYRKVKRLQKSFDTSKLYKKWEHMDGSGLFPRDAASDSCRWQRNAQRWKRPVGDYYIHPV